MKHWWLFALCVAAAAGAQQNTDSPADRLFDFADACFVRGEYDLAAENYSQYLAKYPDGAWRAEATYRLGEAHYQKGRLEQAGTAFLNYINDFPEHEHQARALFRLGEIAYKSGRYDEAISPLVRAAAAPAEPAITEAALYFLGSAYLERQEWAKARDALQRCAEQTQSQVYHVVALIGLIDVALAENSPDQASRWIERLLALPHPPQKPELALTDRHLLRVAVAASKAGLHDTALAAYQRLLEWFPDSALAGQAAIGTVSTLYTQGRYEQAATQGAALVSRYTDPQLAAENRFLTGAALYELGRYAEAASTLVQLVTSPDTPAELVARARHRLVWCAFQQQAWADVIQHGRAVTADLSDGKLTPADLSNVLYLMSQSHVRLGQPAEAATLLEQLLTVDAAQTIKPDAMLQLGWCRLELGQHDAAARVLRDLLDQYPAYPRADSARRYLAQAAAAKGDYPTAAAIYQECIAAATPGSTAVADLYLNLASCYYHVQDFEKLAQTYQQLLAIVPDHPQRTAGLYWIGYKLQADRDYPAAARTFEEVLANPAGLEPAQVDDAGLRLAVCAYQIGNTTAALERLVGLLRQNTKASIPQEFLEWAANQLRDTQHWADAEFVYAALAARYPKPEVVAAALVERGHCRLALNEPDKALALFDTFLKNPDKRLAPRAYLGRGQALLALGRYPEAIKAFEQVDAPTASPEVLAAADLGRAQCLEASQDWQAAYGAYLRVWALFDMEPECPLAAAGCIRAASAMGQPDRVQQIRQELLERYPQSPQAQTLR